MGSGFSPGSSTSSSVTLGCVLEPQFLRLHNRGNTAPCHLSLENSEVPPRAWPDTSVYLTLNHALLGGCFLNI